MSYSYIISRVCTRCAKGFDADPWEVKKGRALFCGRVCANKGRVIDGQTRFWQCVKKTDGCWEWTGTISRYGIITINRRVRLVHRLSWEIHNGSIPAGMYVCHRCDNKICVRPDHLFLGTPKDNIVDAASKGRMACGERHRNAKLTETDVRGIRSLFSAGVPRRDIYAIFAQVNQPTICKVINRDQWKHVQESR